ncbi:hypothetical protein ACM01_04885 [Streptomyces viridochromogenes]|uniref:Uncharacterized protein n=1 Tax=Streptomyces viridochromogenes TaxID=1938 RepID=A0A0J8CF12_STRVR|nr:hypothetical protein [Streptomyces viridochromogenes]KMS76525.1 hypothetical protein ACM01_04885 [Streptomyces viridochromogenes]KOG23302.1 hypothetical protein ADK35_13540 [Streptomyces viridochromogenes]KOG27093.1 hypothetical protein ADK36_00530 [Streptomyces viridochromogenes]
MQQTRPGSFLELYRAALSLRGRFRGDETFAWLHFRKGELAFRKGGLECRVNLSGQPMPLPTAAPVLLESGPVMDGMLAPDTAICDGRGELLMPPPSSFGGARPIH